MTKTIKKVLIALALMAVSLGASAEWYTQPVGTTQTNLYNYYMNKYKTSTNLVWPAFYTQTSTLAQVQILSAAGAYSYKYHSGQTSVGYSITNSNGTYQYKIMCPDGWGTLIKEHIAILKLELVPNSYLLNNFTGQTCGYVPPANLTSLSTIQNIYPSYTVTRLYSNQDIFKAVCMGYCNPLLPNTDLTGMTYYLSNTQRIGYRFPNYYNDPSTYVRTSDTVSSQTAKDDITVLAETYFGGFVYWVNNASQPQYISWFN